MQFDFLFPRTKTGIKKSYFINNYGHCLFTLFILQSFCGQSPVMKKNNFINSYFFQVESGGYVQGKDGTKEEAKGAPNQ